MFRNETKEMFGVGSKIIVESEEYLVTQHNNYIYLINMKSFSIKILNAPRVEDVTFMSEDEVRAIVNKLDNVAFSDCTFDAKGLK